MIKTWGCPLAGLLQPAKIKRFLTACRWSFRGKQVSGATGKRPANHEARTDHGGPGTNLGPRLRRFNPWRVALIRTLSRAYPNLSEGWQEGSNIRRWTGRDDQDKPL